MNSKNFLVMNTELELVIISKKERKKEIQTVKNREERNIDSEYETEK